MYAALSVAAASHEGGVFRTQDGGKSWKRFDKVVLTVCGRELQVTRAMARSGWTREETEARLARQVEVARDVDPDRPFGEREPVEAPDRRGPSPEARRPERPRPGGMRAGRETERSTSVASRARARRCPVAS